MLRSFKKRAKFYNLINKCVVVLEFYNLINKCVVILGNPIVYPRPNSIF